MCKSEIFTELLSVVSAATEITRKDILSSCRQQDIVDARAMLIYILFDHFNFSLKAISKYTGLRENSIYHHICHFREKVEQNRILGIQYAEAVRKLSEKYTETTRQLFNKKFHVR